MAAPSDIMTGKAGLVDRYQAHVVAASNVTLSGEQTIDGVVTSGSKVLCIGQSLTKQNGLYTTAAGAWSRDVALDSDADLAEWITKSISVQVGKGGTSYGLNGYGGLLYRIRPISTATTLGTHGLPWEVVPGNYSLYGNVLTSPTASLTFSDIPAIPGGALILSTLNQHTALVNGGLGLKLGTGGSIDTSSDSFVLRRQQNETSLTGQAYTGTGLGFWGLASTRSTLDSAGTNHLRIESYSSTGTWKAAMAQCVCPIAGDARSNLYGWVHAYTWQNTGPIDNALLWQQDGDYMEIGSSIQLWIEVT